MGADKQINILSLLHYLQKYETVATLVGNGCYLEFAPWLILCTATRRKLKLFTDFSLYYLGTDRKNACSLSLPDRRLSISFKFLRTIMRDDQIRARVMCSILSWISKNNCFILPFLLTTQCSRTFFSHVCKFYNSKIRHQGCKKLLWQRNFLRIICKI